MSNNSKLTPKLRFPEFREGPGWDTELMEQLYSFMRNNSLSRDKLNYQSGTAKNIHYGDIHTKYPALFDITKELVPFVNPTEPVPPHDSGDYCVEGDLIFADASEDTNDVGKSIEIVNLNGERLLAGQHTILARRKDARLIVGFGGYLFRSGRIRWQIQKESQGTKVYAISSSRLTSIEIVFPDDKKEQQKIADCLSSLDELIAAELRKLESLRAYKKGLMQRLFPREGETTPCLRFPEFCGKGDWEQKPLGQVVEVASGQVDPTEPPYCDLPHVGGENIESHTGTIRDVRTANELQLISGKYAFDENDVLYSKIRPALNKVAAPDFKGICSADIYPIRANNSELRRDYLVYLLLSEAFLEYATKHSDRSKIPKVNRDALLSYTVSIPAPAEQQRIAACLGTLDEQMAAQSQKIEGLKQHKKGLMQQLFPSAPEAEA